MRVSPSAGYQAVPEITPKSGRSGVFGISYGGYGRCGMKLTSMVFVIILTENLSAGASYFFDSISVP
jgi:hypothetical protein